MRQLARLAREEGLHAKVGVNFYTYTRTDLPPKEPVNLTEEEYGGLQASFAPIRRCYAHGINDRACYEPLSPVESNRWSADFFASWRQAGFNTKYMIVEYINRGPWQWLPALVADRFAADYKTYAEELDVIEGWMAFGIRPPFAAKTLDYYVFAKLCDKGMEAHRDLDSLTDGFFRDYFGPAGGQVERLYESVGRTFSNISYFYNRPHSVCEGILAKYRPDLLNAAAIDSSHRPFHLPYTSIEDALPFEHLDYQARPDEGANALDLAEMRPRLEEVRGLFREVEQQEWQGVYATRWREAGAQIYYGLTLSQLLLTMVDALKADIEGDEQGAETHLRVIGEHMDILSTDKRIGMYADWDQGVPSTWLLAFYCMLEDHPTVHEELKERFPILREVPRFAQGMGPPPMRPQGAPPTPPTSPPNSPNRHGERR
jgi:hypothetical protein